MNTNETNSTTSTNSSNSLIEKSKTKYDQICSIKPKKGSCLFFKHEALHEGAPIFHGAKYIFRTELICQRVDSPLFLQLTNKEKQDWQEINLLYHKSNQLYGNKNISQNKNNKEENRRNDENKNDEKDSKRNFVESYLLALELQKQKTLKQNQSLFSFDNENSNNE
jgi:hypothetical protein